MFRILLVFLLACACLFVSTPAPAEVRTWTLVNHGPDYADELVRLPVSFDRPFNADKLEVREDGKRVPCQVEVQEGTRARAVRGDIWVLTTIASKASHEYEVRTDGQRVRAEPRITGTGDKSSLVMDNGIVSIMVPNGRQPYGSGPVLLDPVVRLRVAGGKWLCTSRWQSGRKLRNVLVSKLGRGPLFHKIRVRYEFEGMAGVDRDIPAFAEITFTLMPGQPVVHVEESHEMGRDDHWTFVASHGWKPTKGLMRRWYYGQFKAAKGLEEVALRPGQTWLGDTLLNLQPRWTQSYDEGWFFGATDGEHVIGAVPVRAGRWKWPHDNLMRVKVRPSGDYAGIECPTFRGKRYWLLVAGPKSLVETERYEDPKRKGRPPKGGREKRTRDRLAELVTRVAFQSLDKLVNEYFLDWPGMEPGGFRGQFFYSNHTNPTDMIRRWARAAVKDARAGKLEPSRALLSEVQVRLDPDWYGSYWDHWSPINPNFYTDFVKLPVAKAVGLKSHPEFPRIAAMVEDALRTDLYHSVTLPGGAGQECPGYLSHAMRQWKELAPLCEEHFGFDMTKWPRFKAGASFELHVSQPAGAGKRIFHPGGDTHLWKMPDPVELAREWGVDVDLAEDPTGFETEELPGFGVIFRNGCGTDRETYLAFKAGPNRGHHHGDGLSFHYCAHALPVAVDHHASYVKRPGQEHMHNRVAFSTDEWPYTNMDGYERLVAFKTSREADVAVGQVESPRLRKQKKLPPEDWNAIGPLKPLDPPLTYRRTMVLVRRGPGIDEDYFVIRDAHRGPALTSTFCLHVLGDRVERDGRLLRCGDLTLFCAYPKRFDFDNLPWSHEVGGRESTQGLRLSQKGNRTEFRVVMYPSPNAPPMEVVPGGVRVGGDEIVFPGDDLDMGEPVPPVTVKRRGRVVLTLGRDEIDLDRSQGEIGLFVPEAGYPFGPIPDWLIRQRTKVPDWHRTLSAKARGE